MAEGDGMTLAFLGVVGDAIDFIFHSRPSVGGGARIGGSELWPLVTKHLEVTAEAMAIAERANGEQVSLRVHPTFVHKDDLLAQVSGSFNAVSFYGHALGHALFYGRGAGRMPTASAVVSDIIGIALGTTPAQFKKLNVFVDQTAKANVLPFEKLNSRYYLRLTAKDQPGVLAAVTKVLGDQKISLASL
jgi:homoserine dehydrogenase